MRTRTGKMARLPERIREELNQRLLNARPWEAPPKICREPCRLQKAHTLNREIRLRQPKSNRTG